MLRRRMWLEPVIALVQLFYVLVSDDRLSEKLSQTAEHIAKCVFIKFAVIMKNLKIP